VSLNQQALPPVGIITVTWNQVEKTLACLETIFSLDYPEFDVILIDNGSTDGTVAKVQQRFPDVKVTALPQNVGFAKGYNVGLHQCAVNDYPFLFLLNNDTLLAPDVLTHLIEHMRQQPEVGMASAKIYFADEPTRIWSVGGMINPKNLEVTDKFDNMLDQGQLAEIRSLDFVPLCGVLIRGQLIAEIGFLDERFFVYYEDMDFSRRARQAGYQISLVPDAKIWHAVSSSSGGADSPNERYWMARSSVIFFRKHGSPKQAPVIICWRSVSAVRTSFRLLGQRNFSSLRAYWRGLWHGLKESR